MLNSSVANVKVISKYAFGFDRCYLLNTEKRGDCMAKHPVAIEEIYIFKYSHPKATDSQAPNKVKVN